jgi:hypothetical protein
MLAGLIVLSGTVAVFAADLPPISTVGPAYQIVLRSRQAQVTPTRTKEAQTGGGSVLVEQPEPNTVIFTLAGSAVVGSDCCGGSSAAIDFNLTQDMDIIPLRKGLRPPRLGLVGRLVGTLQVTDPCRCCGKCSKPCGTAEQGPATAAVSMGEANLLTIAIQPASVTCGQDLLINHRDGPVECPGVEGCYHLVASFRLGATQGKGCFNRQFAVADFDPAPELDAFWADALKPFRAVPRRDFGFKIVVRVIEDETLVLAPIK